MLTEWGYKPEEIEAFFKRQQKKEADLPELPEGFEMVQ